MKKYILILMIFILTGCQDLIGSQEAYNSIDPYETYNRKIFALNEQADIYILTPVVSTYQTMIPSPLRLGINNFYSNLAEVSCAINSGLQGQWSDCYQSGLRLTVNSLFGVAGIFDMATPLGLPFKHNDFGKTLYLWGYKHSSYFLLPLSGPSTVRDRIGVTMDNTVFNPMNYMRFQGHQHSYIKDLITQELFYLNHLEHNFNKYSYIRNFTESSGIDDKYAFIRDAYFQYRQYQLENGVVNWESFYEELEEDSEHPFA